METNKEEKKEKTVEVSQKYLEEIMQKIERLEATTSKARLGTYDEKHRKPVGKISAIRKIGSKYVVGWSDMIQNRVEQNVVTNKWEEIQEVNIFFIDNTEKKMTYKQWKDRYTKVKCEVVSETKNSDGSVNVTLLLPEGEKVTLDVKFVN